jgi:hypothetical protein
MDDDPKEKPSSKGERLRKEKVAPRKGGYFFAQKFFQHKPTQTFVGDAESQRVGEGGAIFQHKLARGACGELEADIVACHIL